MLGFVGVVTWVIGAGAEMVAVLGWLFGCARGVTFSYLVCNMVCNFCQPCVTVFVIFVTLLDFLVLMCYMPMFCSVGWVYSGCEIVGVSVSLCARRAGFCTAGRLGVFVAGFLVCLLQIGLSVWYS